jgi:hypothetical protein
MQGFGIFMRDALSQCHLTLELSGGVAVRLDDLLDACAATTPTNESPCTQRDTDNEESDERNQQEHRALATEFLGRK